MDLAAIKVNNATASGPTTEQVNQLIDEVERLTGEADAYRLSDKIGTERMQKAEAERDRYKAALEAFVADAYEQSHGASDFVVTTCEALEKAKEVLSVYCHACSLAGGADMPIYHLPPICKCEPEPV